MDDFGKDVGKSWRFTKLIPAYRATLLYYQFQVLNLIMLNRLIINRFVYWSVLLSFAWNIFLLVGVILNLEIAKSRAAGGQFTEFPAIVRVIYLLQLALVLYQVWIFKEIFHAKPIRLKLLPKIFFMVGITGILLNAVSRSSNERWNVIPAAVITWAFWNYGIRKEKS